MKKLSEPLGAAQQHRDDSLLTCFRYPFWLFLPRETSIAHFAVGLAVAVISFVVLKQQILTDAKSVRVEKFIAKLSNAGDTDTRRQHPDSQHTLRFIPRNSIIIVGSLDTSAALHECTLKFRPLKNSRTKHSCDLNDCPPDLSLGANPDTAPELHCAESTSHHHLTAENVVRVYNADEWISDSWALSLKPLSSGMSLHRRNQLTRAEETSEHPTASGLGRNNGEAWPRRRFLVPRFRDGGCDFRPLTAEMTAQSPRVVVFRSAGTYRNKNSECDNEQELKEEHFETQAAALLDAAVCAELESDILDLVSGVLGPVEDIDGDQRLTIVIAPLNEGIHDPDDGVLGCVRSSDILNPSEAGAGDIIYLNDQLTEKQQLRAILAHELAHACVYSELLRSVRRDSTNDACFAGRSSFEPAMPSWMNEAIAHQIECLVDADSANFRRRVKLFLAAPQLCPVFTNENTMTLAARRGGARAAATLFLSYSETDQRFRELLNFQETPLQRIERGSHHTFSELFRRWSLSVHRLAAGVAGGNTVIDSSQTGQLYRRLNPGINSANGRTGADADGDDADGDTETFELRGTAVGFLQASDRIEHLEISADPGAKLQITVLLPEE